MFVCWVTHSVIILLLFCNVVSARLVDVLEQASPVSYCGYELEAIYISDDIVKFRLNNETSDLLGYHDSFQFKEGSRIFIREILEEEVLEGPDMVSIRFYPNKCFVVKNDSAVEIDVNVSMDNVDEDTDKDGTIDMCDFDIEGDGIPNVFVIYDTGEGDALKTTDYGSYSDENLN